MKLEELHKYAFTLMLLFFVNFAYGQIKPPSSIEASQGDFTDRIYFSWEKVEEAKTYKVCIYNLCDGAARVVSSNEITIGSFKPTTIDIIVYSCSDESCDSTSEKSISATGFSDFSSSKTTQDIIVEYDKDNENRLLISTQPTKAIYVQTCIDISCSFPLSYTFNQWKTGKFFWALDGSEKVFLFRFCEIVTNKNTSGYLCEEKKTILPFTPVSNWEDVKGTSFVVDTTENIQDTTGDDSNSSNNSEDTENDSDSDDNSSDNSSDDTSTNEGSNSEADDTNNDDEGDTSDTKSDDNENNSSNNTDSVAVGSGLKWSMGNWGESNWYKSTWSITTGSSNSTIPDIPQQSLARISKVDKTISKAAISMGASKDNGNTTSTKFKEDDNIILTAEIYPEPNDLGESGELYVVLVNRLNGKKEFFALEDSVWVPWNQSLKTLPAAKYVNNLSNKESILIYSGYMTAGIRNIYVGYSLLTESGKPLIHFNGIPFQIEITQ